MFTSIVDWATNNTTAIAFQIDLSGQLWIVAVNVRIVVLTREGGGREGSLQVGIKSNGNRKLILKTERVCRDGPRVSGYLKRITRL